MHPWRAIAERIQAVIGMSFQPSAPTPVSGGCVNDAMVLADGRQRFFVKLNRADTVRMYEAEAEGLAAIAAARTLRVPVVIDSGVVADIAYLALEYLEPGEPGGRGGDAALGDALAAMHGHTAEQFGWHRDNTIGTTPQPNAWHNDWIGFLRERRIGYLLDRACARGADARLRELGDELLLRLPELFSGYTPVPSLLHGDLWGGNWLTLASGEPAVFDPAVYYGDREADLAMTELFGGFAPRFYAAYEAAWPLDAGYAQRKDLYNLYHVLNHFLLFGGGYDRQARVMAARLLALLR
jgi:protein-ribulosamine 3-kinase